MVYLERHAVQRAIRHHPDKVRLRPVRIGIGPTLFSERDMVTEMVLHRLGGVPVALVVDSTNFQNLVDPPDEQAAGGMQVS